MPVITLFQIRTLPLAAAAALSLVSCSSGPEPVRTGTPAYYWQVANENYTKGDFAKTADWLEKITKASKNDFSAKAWIYQLIVTSGTIRGNAELADEFEIGERVNKAASMKFHKYTANFRGAAARASMGLHEAYNEFEKAFPDGDVTAEFAVPAGTIAKPQGIAKIQTGQIPTEAEVPALASSMLQRGVIEQICDLTGSAGDVAKAQLAMKTPPVTIPRAAFELTMAKTLHETSKIFGGRKENDTNKQEAFCNLAMKAAGRAGDSADVKELKGKIEKDLKEIKARKG